VGLVEWIGIFLPLAFHGCLGTWLVATRTPLAQTSPYSPAMRIAMRTTAVVAALFVSAHLPQFRFRLAGGRLDGGELATLLAADLSATSHGVPWPGLAYLAGTACVTFHFVVGIWGSIAKTRRGRESAIVRKRAAWAMGAVGGAMWLTFANVVVFHTTGARLLGGQAEEQPPPEACPP
jgi:succinate dehydrogenase/fumarate reductase cytochrome b subunit